jgi:hypothetical protein
VFGPYGNDDDGADQWEAAELHFGLNFGCIHYIKRIETIKEDVCLS